MDSLITAAARALATGDPVGALKRVNLRDDAPALALRGIAMAQLSGGGMSGKVRTVRRPKRGSAIGSGSEIPSTQRASNRSKACATASRRIMPNRAGSEPRLRQFSKAIAEDSASLPGRDFELMSEPRVARSLLDRRHRPASAARAWPGGRSAEDQ
jgi:hypothetical protein